MAPPSATGSDYDSPPLNDSPTPERNDQDDDFNITPAPAVGRSHLHPPGALSPAGSRKSSTSSKGVSSPPASHAVQVTPRSEPSASSGPLPAIGSNPSAIPTAGGETLGQRPMQEREARRRMSSRTDERPLHLQGQSSGDALTRANTAANAHAGSGGGPSITFAPNLPSPFDGRLSPLDPGSLLGGHDGAVEEDRPAAAARRDPPSYTPPEAGPSSSRDDPERPGRRRSSLENIKALKDKMIDKLNPKKKDK